MYFVEPNVGCRPYQGCIKFLTPSLGGKFIKSFWEEFQVVKRRREFNGFWEEYHVEKRVRGRNIMFYNIKALV